MCKVHEEESKTVRNEAFECLIAIRTENGLMHGTLEDAPDDLASGRIVVLPPGAMRPKARGDRP